MSDFEVGDVLRTFHRGFWDETRVASVDPLTFEWDGRTFASLTSVACAIKRSHGCKGRVSGPAFFGIDTEECRGGCGLRYGGFHPAALSFAEAYAFNRHHPVDTKNGRRALTGTAYVRGRMAQARRDRWEEHQMMCEQIEKGK